MQTRCKVGDNTIRNKSFTEFGWEEHRSTVWTIFAPNNTEITNTDYQRVTNLLYKRQSTQNAIFFLELNAKHIHTPEKVGVTGRVSGTLGACIC